MKIFFSAALLALMGLTASAQRNQVDLTSELKKLMQFEELPTYWDNTAIKQFSSYDRTGNNDDGFSGKHSFLRKEKDSSLVIFEAKGNGVINRIWTPTPTEDMLDFYFSGSDKPDFSIKFADLFSGKVYPFLAPLTGNELGGFYSYMPIPFRNGCKVVLRGKHLQFYQIQYRSYPKNVKITNFDPQLSPEAKTTLSKIESAWETPLVEDMKPMQVSTKLSPGKSVTIADISSPGRITGIRLHNASAFEGLNKQIMIKMTWDNEKPAVYMPVADFFGYAFGQKSMQSLLLGSADNINYCYFPMPFEKNANIELIYLPDNGKSANGEIDITAEVYTSNKKYDPKNEGKFYAYWHADKQTKPGKPHMLLTGKGKGHYVGTILQSQGLEPGMTLFFEGDDVTTIDGELRVHGTGSEDYFNGGWYALLDRWDTKMSLPLHGSLDYSLPFARTGGYRLFIADKMPFNESIVHTIEHGPENNNKPGDYTSVAFYYAGSAINNDQAVPAGDLLKVYQPDTLSLFPQLMKYSIGGAVKIDGHVFHSATGGQVKIDLSEIPKGTYKVYADIDKSPDGASVAIWQRQKMIEPSFSFFAEKTERQPNAYLCTITLDDFKNAITLSFKADSKRSIMNLHRLILIRETK